MPTEAIPRHVAWRRMYREKRYCRNLSQVELNQRIRDIFVGLLRTSQDAKIGLPPMGPEGIRAMELWTHVLEEMVIRHGPYPNGFTREILHSEPFPDFVGELGRRTASILAGKGIQPDKVFIKFGKAKYMRSLFEEGALRVSPASHYSAPSHNGAIRDDELVLPISLSLTREDIIKVVKNPEDVPDGPIDQRLDFQYKSATDYWIYCLTTVAEPRLFVDFDADACVIIKDKDRFQRLLTLQSAQHFPGTGHKHGRVSYVDPLLPSTAHIDVPMSKHFRYDYQKEYRFVWRPTQPRSDLPPVELKLGSLEHIAELVVVN